MSAYHHEGFYTTILAPTALGRPRALVILWQTTQKMLLSIHYGYCWSLQYLACDHAEVHRLPARTVQYRWICRWWRQPTTWIMYSVQARKESKSLRMATIAAVHCIWTSAFREAHGPDTSVRDGNFLCYRCYQHSTELTSLYPEDGSSDSPLSICFLEWHTWKGKWNLQDGSIGVSPLKPRAAMESKLRKAPCFEV